MKIRIDLEPSKWSSLSMKDRAKYIHNSVLNHYANGGSLTELSIDDIRHLFEEGGKLEQEYKDNQYEFVDGQMRLDSRYKESPNSDIFKKIKTYDDFTPEELNYLKDTYKLYLANPIYAENAFQDLEVPEYFKSYVNSKGFDRILNNLHSWWESRHPYRKYYNPWDEDWEVDELKLRVLNDTTPVFIADSRFSTAESYNAQGPKTRDAGHKHIIFIGRRDEPASTRLPFLFPIALTEGHEYAHTFNGNFTGALKEALDMNTNTDLSEKFPDAKINWEHDVRDNEKHSDIWGLKYLLYKEGIYDSRSDKDITLDLVRELRKRYPDLRPLILMSDELIVFMLNNVASNRIDLFKTDKGYISADGGNLYVI